VSHVTQAITQDDPTGGLILLSGNINIITSPSSAGYSPICSPPSSFIASNANVTIAPGSNIRILSSARVTGPVICSQVAATPNKTPTPNKTFMTCDPPTHLYNTRPQHTRVMGSFDASPSPFAGYNGAVLSGEQVYP